MGFGFLRVFRQVRERIDGFRQGADPFAEVSDVRPEKRATRLLMAAGQLGRPEFELVRDRSFRRGEFGEVSGNGYGNRGEPKDGSRRQRPEDGGRETAGRFHEGVDNGA